MTWPTRPRNRPNRRRAPRRVDYGPLKVQSCTLDPVAGVALIGFNQPIIEGPNFGSAIFVFQGVLTFTNIQMVTKEIIDDGWTLRLSSPASALATSNGLIGFDNEDATAVVAARGGDGLFSSWIRYQLV